MKQFVSHTRTYLTRTLFPLRQAEVALLACGVHDVPQNLSDEANMMRGFTEQIVGSFTGPISDEYWKLCLNSDKSEDVDKKKKPQPKQKA